jgi:hypothetical protein
MGLSSAYRCARVHPPDRARPPYRRLSVEPRVECLPRHSRPRLRSTLRAGLQARPRRGQTGGDLPTQARRVGSAGRVGRPVAKGARGQERQAHCLRRRRPRFIDGGERSGAARLRRDDSRTVRRPGRVDAHQHPILPPAAESARRGDRHDPRYGRNAAPGQPGPQSA